MTPPTRTKLGSLACLLVGAVAFLGASVPVHAAAASDDVAQRGRPKTEEKRYLYSATFDATVTNDLKLLYPGSNNDEVRHFSAAISGVHRALEVSTTKKYDLIPRSTKSSVRVGSAEATAVSRTDDGRSVVTCSGSAARAEGRPSPVPSLLSGSDFLPYASLAFPTSCTDNQGGAPGSATYFLSPLHVEVNRVAGKPGDAVLTYHLETGVGTPPLTSPADCPGFEEGTGNTCAYQVTGTLTLKLIKEVTPAAGSSKGASVTPGATKAVAQVACPAACRMEIEVMPLRGSPRVLARDTFTLEPGRKRSVQLPIPARNRQPAVKSGGIRLRITYRIAGVGAFSETRTALL